MASKNELKLLHQIAVGNSFNGTNFDVSGGEVIIKPLGVEAGDIAAGAVTVAELSDVANTRTAEFVVETMTTTAMSTNATFRGAFVAPAACTLTNAYLVPHVAITGADTNTFHVNLQDRGAAGSGTDEIANLDFVSGTDAAILNNLSFGTLSATHKVLAAGDVVAVQMEKIGDGQASPRLSIVLAYQLDDE